MASLLEFECRVPVDGYRVLYFDESKFVDVEVDEDGSVSEPPDATDDELYLLRRWGARIIVTPEMREAFFEAASYPWEPQILAYFEPVSERVRCFDLFEEMSSPYIDFANLDLRPSGTKIPKHGMFINVEGAKALADRYGPLYDGPKFAYDWIRVALSFSNALKVWEKAVRTGNFKPLVRTFSKKGLKLVGRNRIDASITIYEDIDTGEARLCIRPETLLDALYTQLAQSIDGSQSLRNCVVCKQWFTISAGQGRSDKEYCSDACKMRAYRERNKKKHRKRAAPR